MVANTKKSCMGRYCKVLCRSLLELLKDRERRGRKIFCFLDSFLSLVIKYKGTRLERRKKLP